MKNRGIKSAWGFAGTFLLATVLGFVSNPIVGKYAFFITNTAHNLVHLATAVGFMIVAIRGETASIRFMQVFGIVYVLTALLGFVSLGGQPDGYLLHLIHINVPDNFLHLALGLSIEIAGWLSLGHRPQSTVAGRA